jgi:hypothetical protein
MLHELVPKASIIAVLRDPNGPDVESQSRDLEEALSTIGDNGSSRQAVHRGARRPQPK